MDPRARLRPRPATAGRRLGVLAAVVYLGAVVTFEMARRGAHGPTPGDVASSPGGVASGHVLALLTSGLAVAGEPGVQLAGAAVTGAAVLALVGPGAFWRAAFAGHVVATLVTYAGVGLIWLVSRTDVDHVIDAPDYGISAVWAGSLGALVVAGLRASSHVAMRVVAIGAVLLFLAVIPFSTDLAGVEHALAFILGGLASARRPVRPGWARTSAPVA